mgnify:CR=1 FL=1
MKKEWTSRRDYTEEDLQTIKGAWGYYERGFSVQSAVELVQRAHLDQVYLLSKVPAGKLSQAQGVLRSYDRVVEVTAVYGEDGSQIPVTVVNTTKNIVVDKRTLERDGYSAVVMGFGERTMKRVSKPRRM